MTVILSAEGSTGMIVIRDPACPTVVVAIEVVLDATCGMDDEAAAACEDCVRYITIVDVLVVCSVVVVSGVVVVSIALGAAGVGVTSGVVVASSVLDTAGVGVTSGALVTAAEVVTSDVVVTSGTTVSLLDCIVFGGDEVVAIVTDRLFGRPRTFSASAISAQPT